VDIDFAEYKDLDFSDSDESGCEAPHSNIDILTRQDTAQKLRALLPVLAPLKSAMSHVRKLEFNYADFEAGMVASLASMVFPNVGELRLYRCGLAPSSVMEAVQNMKRLRELQVKELSLGYNLASVISGMKVRAAMPATAGTPPLTIEVYESMREEEADAIDAVAGVVCVEETLGKVAVFVVDRDAPRAQPTNNKL